MNAIEKLFLLVPSLTKAEKRSFSISQKESDYYQLYQLILENKSNSTEELEAVYKALRPDSNIQVTALYLLDKILETLCALEERKNLSMQLIRKIHSARILMNKSIYQGALDLLEEVKKISKRNKQNEIFLQAAQTELDLLLRLDFVGLTEKELAHRHHEVEESIKAIWKSEGVASLYDLVKYRTFHYDIMRSEEQKNSLNDLLQSEEEINAIQGDMNFEAKKFHQLFQATYLMGIHDYDGALNALKELINIFKTHPHVWENNKFYYIEALENALHSLRLSGQYESIDYFLKELDLVKPTNQGSQSYQKLVKLQYQIIPLIDKGEFALALSHMKEHENVIRTNIDRVNLDKQAELYLYAAIIYFGVEQFDKVKELLTPIIFQTRIYSILPMMRTIRLLHLMTIYELDLVGDYDFEIKSLRRNIGNSKHSYRMELVILKFIQQPKFTKNPYSWEQWKEDILTIREDVFEKQLLNIFDFTKWIEAKLTKRKLTDLFK